MVMDADRIRQALIEVTRGAETSRLSPFFDTLSEERLSKEYDPCEWAIGPFERIEELTYEKTARWVDPWDIGWEGRAIHNACLIEEGGKLHMFYRCNPTMESLSARVGLAVHDDDGGWVDHPENPIIYSTLENETLGCEDPKVYRAEGRFFLFYEAAFTPSDEDREAYGDPGMPVGEVGCEINMAESEDLVHWFKQGPIIPRSVTHLWAKAGVIPRDGDGNAMKIGGRYMMFISEGCGGRQVVGYSEDMRHWEFRQEEFLDTSPLGRLAEVMSLVAASEDDEHLVMDFFYTDDSGIARAGEALYRKAKPTKQLALNRGGTLNVGGLLRYRGRWIHAQGWDAPPGVPEMQIWGTKA
jgi:hypothetical protein